MIHTQPIKGLLLDLDGTLYHGSRMIAGADRLIEQLIRTNIPFRYVTNNSSLTPSAFADRLQGMGIAATAKEVCTSAEAAAAYIAQVKPRARVFVIGESGLRQAVEEAGLTIVEEGADFVVQGLDRDLSYNKIARAVDQLLSGAESIMTNPDLLIPTEHGLQPGAGSIGAMIQAASGKTPTVIGKPSSILMNFALNSLGVSASQTWMVGDSLATDIAAGKAVGCGTALVLTGLTTADNFESYAAKTGCRPDVICADLDALSSYISERNGQ
ncbi:HAD-superfamily hydrolase, subfamily IIA [Paenibacillus curdlanolyticus YK9]|uniref:Acid sugar phosphatase n=1 Tax=Paenibacillus curdlanolyticus YK9 TaxID=717606 RepID=E0I548_9BACL|nr:HAD-IIA family hydrolase [Paenibacillus curdlanolyticus]EFM12090.1 HAD-superfamily hydrolase, subfamily IIA [Paenibacillus curdlanolyticus YK9]